MPEPIFSDPAVEHDPYTLEVAQRARIHRRDEHELARVKPVHMRPHFNELYDTLRTRQGWRYMADNWANGTFATSLTATTTQAVKLNIQSTARVMQWPRAPQVYLVLRRFSIAPTTSQAGELECTYEDGAGYIVPLGEFVANAGGSVSYDDIIPTPITDPLANNPQVGVLRVTLNGGVTTAPTIFWMMSFSYAYLLPSEHGYEEEHGQYVGIHP